ICLEVVHPSLLNEFDDPAWIKIDAEADAAAKLTHVFDGQAQPPRARRSQHEPIRTLGKVLLRQGRAEHFIVDAKIIYDDAALRNAGGPTRLEDVDRFALKRFRHPPTHRPAAQPFVLE